MLLAKHSCANYSSSENKKEQSNEAKAEPKTKTPEKVKEKTVPLKEIRKALWKRM